MSKGQRSSAILLTAYCLLLTVFIGCSSGPQGKQPTARIGEPAPAFTLNLVDGTTIGLDSFRGKPLVITYMASWCPCSHESAPVFKSAYNIYHPRGVEFLIIGIQDSERRFKRYLQDKQFQFPGGFDEKGRIARLFGVNAPPTTFFISRDGKIIRAFYGRITRLNQLSDWIEEIIG